jgi:uncharacterized protein (TIGR02147 family)
LACYLILLSHSQRGRLLENIYAYYDYRKYLNDFYKEKKSKDAFFSFRYISRRVGVDHGLLVKVFQGERHIGAKSIPDFTRLLELSARKAEYFELLVLYGKAKTDREIKHYFEKILDFSEIHSHKIESDKYEFYQKWYYTVVREIIHIVPYNGDYEWLSGMVEPPITPAEAKKAVLLLERLGLIRRNTQGIFEQTSPFITSGEGWKSIAIRSFQKECLYLAARAIDALPKETRDISTVTLTLDDEGFEKVRERVVGFQQELIGIASACSKVNAVYQVNMQVFPLSKKAEHSNKDNAP